MSRSHHIPQFVSCLIFVFAILWPSAASWGQTDSVIVLSPRVGRMIDSRERMYFDLFRDCPESEFVFLAEDAAEAGRFVFRSSNPERNLATIDSAALMKLRESVDYREAVREGIVEEERADARDELEGAEVTVELTSSRRRSGELLFADLHGMVIRDSVTVSLLASDIRSATTPRVFGEGTRVMAQVGMAAGIAIFGVGGALGKDAEAAGGVFMTVFFSGLGSIVGLLYDIFAAAAGDVKLVSAHQPWDEEVVLDLQSISRFPFGTPELKRLLGEAHELSLRQQ